MIQTDFLDTLKPQNSIEQRAHDWIHTPEGGEIMNKFIRVAIGLKRSGFDTFGAKAIAERLRWHYKVKNRNREEEQEAYKINNTYVTYMAKYAAISAPEDLDGFFRFKCS